MIQLVEMAGTASTIKRAEPIADLFVPERFGSP